MNNRSVVDANWPAQSEPSLFAKVALSVTVPVVVSTALSMKLSVPSAGDAPGANDGGSPAPCLVPTPPPDAGVSCAGASTGAPVDESARFALTAAPPGKAVTGNRPRAPY